MPRGMRKKSDTGMEHKRAVPVCVEKEEGYAVVTINRPRVNQLNIATIKELSKVLGELEVDVNIKAIIITGAGESFFSAGADLTDITEDIAEAVRRGQEMCNQIEQCNKPVIAAIGGHALGGGCELAMASHFRIMKEGARIGLVESNLGIIPGWSGTQRMPRLIGRAKATEYMILGTKITADEALRIGLVNKLAKGGEVLNEAKRLAQKLAKRHPLATRAIINCVNKGLNTTLDEGLAIEREYFTEVAKTREAKEAVQALLKKSGGQGPL
jgi:enoyl-CoA hydratase/carnithine racemase